MLNRRGRSFLLLIFVGLTIVSAIGLSKLSFAFNFEAFLPEDDPDIVFYNEFKSQFQSGSNSVLVGVKNEGGVFEKEFLEEVAKFTRCARRLPLATEAYSLTNIRDYLYDPSAPMMLPVLDFRGSEDLEADSARIMGDQRWPGNFISRNGDMLIVHISTPSERTQTEENWFNESLTALIAEFGWENQTHVVGYPIFHYTMLNYQTTEFGTYTLIATLVMLTCMALLFRRFWGTVVAFFSVMLGLIIFFGFLGWIGRPIDLMATLYPVLMVIVGTSDVVHIMTKYVEELHRGMAKADALRVTIREIGLATFMTSLTTAIGFLSLLTSNMPPIRNFGLFAAVGVFMAFGTVILLTTALVSWFSADQLMRPRKVKPFSRTLGLFKRTTHRFPRAIAWGTLVFIVVTSLAASQSSLSLTNVRDFPLRSQVKADFLAIDEALGGVNTLDMALQVLPEGRSLFEVETQRELRRLENYLLDLPETGPVTSPLTMFRILHYSLNYLNPDSLAIVENQVVFDQEQEMAGDFMRNELGFVLSEDGRSAWMYTKIPDIGSGPVMDIKEEVSEFAEAELEPGLFRLTHTGARHIFDKHQELLVISLLKSLGLAFLLVSIFMGLIFRNFRVVIISLIPNIIPLLATAALIGALGLELDPKIAIVFTVAFGIAVDDSIHFLSRFKLERDKGQTNAEAISATFDETGRAIIITTLILFAGFGTLLGSAFPPTLIIGLLLSLTLIVALVADFLLIPVLIRWLLKDQVKVEEEVEKPMPVQQR